jgi:hypothetical protein
MGLDNWFQYNSFNRTQTQEIHQMASNQSGNKEHFFHQPSAPHIRAKPMKQRKGERK